MAIIPLVIYFAELAIVALVIWFLCPFLGMPANPTRICQVLIVLICILSGLEVIISSTIPNGSSSGPVPPHPLTPLNPSRVP